MAEPDKPRGKAETWPPRVPPSAATIPRPAWAWPNHAAEFAEQAANRIREWLAAEAGAGMLVPWLAVVFGCGILVYFSRLA